MNKYNTYNPLTHRGYLPVRVLQYNVIDWLEKVAPDFLDDVKHEVENNGLNPGIKYHIEKSQITSSAYIDLNKGIHLYENYNQFLWTLCYSLLVIFDIGIKLPILLNKFQGSIDVENIFVKRSIALFNNGISLFSDYSDSVFYKLPNPENYNEFEKVYIEKANSIYVAALTFTLIHEFSHQYYGHLDHISFKDKAKTDELNSDDYAFDLIKHNFSNEKSFSYKVGIIAALTSLIFFDNSLKGGDEHPDPDERITKLLSQMDLNDVDNAWGIAGLAFILWSIHYTKKFELPKEASCFKELYDKILSNVSQIKRES